MSLAVPIVMPGSLAVIVSSVMMTVSVPSTRLSATILVISMVSLVAPAEDRDRAGQVVVVGAFGRGAGHRVVDDGIADSRPLSA